MTPITSNWFDLRLPPQDLREARLQCHHAVQINTRLARAFAEAQADDSHTNLGWDSGAEALMGRVFRAGLRVRDLTFLFEGAEVPLDGLTWNEAVEAVGKLRAAQGLDPAALAQPIHFEMEDHPLLRGARFDAASNAEALGELARYYSNASLSVAAFASPVRCWPHHFDIAAQYVSGAPGRSVGIGMSPGDGSYEEPYFYVSPWPPPATDRLPALHSSGHWHTEGWTGAVLPASRFVPADLQEAAVRAFLEDAVTKSAALEWGDAL